MAAYRLLGSNAGQVQEVTDTDVLLAPTQAIAEGAASPAGATNNIVWSSTEGCILRWTGTIWTKVGINDKKLSGLAALAPGGTNLDWADLRLAVDSSDTSMGAGGTNKKETVVDDLAMVRKLNTNQSVASQTGFAADTYLVGSNFAIPANYPIVGSTYKLIFDVTKTAAGLLAPTITIRIGTLGTTADASICSIVFGVGTAVVDSGIFEVIATFRTVGSGTTAVLQSIAGLVNNLTTTGLSNAVKAKQVTSAGFNSTTASSIIGATYNGGTSAAHTIQLVRSELVL